MSAEDNIQQFRAELGRWVDEIWTFPDDTKGRQLHLAWNHCLPDTKIRGVDIYGKRLIIPRVKQSIQRLLERWSRHELSVILADVYAHYGTTRATTPISDNDDIAVILSIAWLRDNPPDNLFQVLRPIFYEHWDRFLIKYRYLELLKTPKPNEDMLDGYIQILTGKTAMWNRDFSQYVPELMSRLFLADKLTFPIFLEAIKLCPQCFEKWFRNPVPSFDQKFIDQIKYFYQKCINEYLVNNDPDLYSVIASIYDITGPPECLFQALNLFESKNYKLDRTHATIICDETQTAIMSLAMIAEQTTDHTSVLERLKTYNPMALQGILPYARNYRPLIARALGYEQGIDLINLLAQFIGIDELKYTPRFMHDLFPQPLHIDIQSLENAIVKAGKQLSDMIMDIFYQRLHINFNIWSIIHAIIDKNRMEVMRRVSRKDLLSIRAYGFLPINHGLDEIRQRFERLMKIEATSHRLAPRHQIYQREAVAFALSGLAQRAGYSDVEVFKAAMQPNAPA